MICSRVSQRHWALGVAAMRRQAFCKRGIHARFDECIFKARLHLVELWCCYPCGACAGSATDIADETSNSRVHQHTVRAAFIPLHFFSEQGGPLLRISFSFWFVVERFDLPIRKRRYGLWR